MALTRNFKTSTSLSNQTALSWDQPLGFNNTNDELIITRTITHYPMELYNANFPDKATDIRPIEIFRGSNIVGEQSGNITVSGNILTDTNASFPTSPGLAGRLLRDSTSKVFRIISNTTTTVTLDDEPVDDLYIILSDFPTEVRPQENYEIDIRTEVGPGFIKNLVIIENQILVVKEFEEDELANLIFRDGNNDLFIVKSNTADTVFFFDSSTPQQGTGMTTFNSFFDSQILPYIDSFRTESDAASRTATGLRDNKFYYYTIFTKLLNANVAQAEFSTINSGVATQDESLSTKDNDFGNILYRLWPSMHREMDTSGDLQDLMSVFGFQFNELHSLIQTYELQDPDNVLVSALLPLSEQTGLPSVGFSIGADTLRRIARNMIQCWKLKGSKEGIAVFIRKITTWDITDGTADFGDSIQDFLPNVGALRFFDPNLGSLNVRLTQTDPFVSGGRFATSLPGVVIPGFFTFREFVITLRDVALFAGTSEDFSVASGTTTLTDTTANFGATDSLIGNFLIPNTEEVNDIFEIVGNTSTTITVRGVINNRTPGGNYAVLSPLNSNRFIILNSLLPVYIPFGTRAGFIFV